MIQTLSFAEDVAGQLSSLCNSSMKPYLHTFHGTLPLHIKDVSFIAKKTRLEEEVQSAYILNRISCVQINLSIITCIAYAYRMRVINYNSRKSKRCGFVRYIWCEFFKAEIRSNCGGPTTDLQGVCCFVIDDIVTVVISSEVIF